MGSHRDGDELAEGPHGQGLQTLQHGIVLLQVWGHNPLQNRHGEMVRYVFWTPE